MLEKNVPYQSCQIDFWLKMKLILFYNEFKIFRSELLAILHRILNIIDFGTPHMVQVCRTGYAEC